MELIESIAELHRRLAPHRAQARVVALVPTMGYLHQGHLSHIKIARHHADVVVVSIFVNPAQFAPEEDLASYPRNPERDIELLESSGCDILFVPSVAEVYPDGFSTYVTVEGIGARYEGAVRPTHFRGVATVVIKLLNMVRPELVTLGRKDAQQIAVVARMIRDLNMSVEILPVPTLREPDGLAMSSRNVYLTSDDRREASTISLALRRAQALLARGSTVAEALAAMHDAISPAITLDYAEIVDPNTFEQLKGRPTRALAIIAGRVGRARLIDNMDVGSDVAEINDATTEEAVRL